MQVMAPRVSARPRGQQIDRWIDLIRAHIPHGSYIWGIQTIRTRYGTFLLRRVARERPGRRPQLFIRPGRGHWIYNMMSQRQNSRYNGRPTTAFTGKYGAWHQRVSTSIYMLQMLAAAAAAGPGHVPGGVPSDDSISLSSLSRERERERVKSTSGP